MGKQIFPEPTVGCLIFNPKEEILMVKSHKWKGKYVISGGHIELGETAEEALIREIREETGLKIYDLKFLVLQEFIYGKEFWKKKHFIFLDYTARTKSTKVKLNDEAEKYVWVLPKKALKLPVEPYSRKTILAYLKK
jgi:nucleoside triphosphatase